MRKNLKNYTILVIFSLAICTSMAQLIVNDLSYGVKPSTTNTNTTQTSDTMSNPLGNIFGGGQLNFNPFQGFNFPQQSIQNPISNNQQTVNPISQQPISQQPIGQQPINQQQISQQNRPLDSSLLNSHNQQGGKTGQSQSLFDQSNQQQFIPTQQVYQQNNQQSQQASQPSQPQVFKMSTNLKHEDISTISNSRVKADLSNSYKIFMMNTSLQTQCKGGCTNEFKIVQNSGWLALGVCEKNRILMNNFKWNKDKIGHATYLLGSFGASWSSIKESVNDVMKSFKFTTNEVVRITYNPRAAQIIFDKKGTEQTFTLEYDWRSSEDLYLCGILYYGGDQVQYLGSNVYPEGDDRLMTNLEKDLRQTKLSLNMTDVINLRRLFNTKVKSVQLCYRGSENSFSSSTFHTKCDGKSNTLTLIQTTSGHKMGGFTPLAWDGSCTYASDSSRKGFLFSLTFNEKFNIKDGSNSIYKNNAYGPTFGSGHDLYVASGSGSGSGSYCNIGTSYENPYSAQIGRNKLCGSYNFNTKQYQVWVVTFE